MGSYDKSGIIPISEARQLGEKYKAMNIVIFAIEKSGKRFTVTTWGKTKELCAWGAQVSEDIHKAVMDGFVCNGSAHTDNPYEKIDILARQLEVAGEALRYFADDERIKNGVVDLNIAKSALTEIEKLGKA